MSLGKGYLSEPVPFAAIIDKRNRSASGCRIHFQGTGNKCAVEIATPSGTGLDGVSQAGILTVVENVAFRRVLWQIGVKPFI